MPASKAKPLKFAVTCKLSQEDYKAFQNFSRQSGIKRSTFLRQSLLASISKQKIQCITALH
uniref:CopG family transcriptional regulator n=1 Tax=Tolypothrix bouteillei VB521301 TaxID=1479485 RepID=A0A0C1R860_9CYAN